MEWKKMNTKKNQKSGIKNHHLQHIKNNSSIYYFFISCLLIIGIKFLLFPSLTIHPEVFAESGTNFFYNAYFKDIFTNITTVDAGYLPWIQRFIAVITIKVFHQIVLYPYITQWSGIICISLFCSLFTLPVFRRLIASDIIRFFIAIGISMVSDYELNTFINFIYFGAIYLLLITFVNKEKINKYMIGLLALIAGLIICSKGYFIVFLPTYGLLMLYHGKNKEYKSFFFYLLTLIIGSLQVWTMYLNSSHVSQSHSSLILIVYIVKTVYYVILTYRHVLFGSFNTDKRVFFSIVLVLVSLIYGICQMVRKKQHDILKFIVICNFIAFCSLFLTVVLTRSNTAPVTQHITSVSQIHTNTNSTTKQKVNTTLEDTGNKSVFFVKHYVNLRNMFISNLLLFLASLVIILNIFVKTKYQLFALFFLLYASGTFGQISVEEPYTKPAQSYSQWRIYNQLVKKPSFCIPLNHYSFVLKNNCDYLTYIDLEHKLPYTTLTENVVLKDITPEAVNWNLNAIVLLNKDKQYTATKAEVFAYDGNDNIISKAVQLTPSNYDYVYFLFSQNQKNIVKLVWKQGNHIVPIVPNLILFGTDTVNQGKRFEYPAYN
jgi:hypothetical protein